MMTNLIGGIIAVLAGIMIIVVFRPRNGVTHKVVNLPGMAPIIAIAATSGLAFGVMLMALALMR